MFVREASALGPPTMTSEPWYAFLTLLRSYDSFRHCVFSLCLRHRHRLFIFLFSNSVMEKRVCTNGLTTTVNVPTFMLMSTEVLLMIMWYTRSNPRTRTQSNSLHANGFDCVTQAAADSEILLSHHSKFGSSLHSGACGR